jgi:hypothetical protein
MVSRKASSGRTPKNMSPRPGGAKVPETSATNGDSTKVLIGALRGAIENSVRERAKRRLLLLLDAINLELTNLTTVP